jgi:inosine-uridine nucleoside N-ribohydrolase
MGTASMTDRFASVVVAASLVLCAPPPRLVADAAQAAAAPAKVRVIADQDSAGPEGTNFLSLLMLLNAPQIDLLGITTVSGDQWVEPSTVFALYATELTGRTDVSVVKGAERPLLNSAREQELREALYGSFLGWHGSLNPDTPPPSFTWPPPGGYPRTKPRPGRAADFLIDTIRANPNEVVLYFAGPLTNLALAVSMDPGIVPLTRALYIMGASSSGGPELNWWWDPEAAAIVMRQPWREIVVTPGEAGSQPFSNEAMMRRVVQAGGRLAQYVQSVYLDARPLPGTSMWSPMWDEVLVAALVDPSVIVKSETMWLDVDITHGPKYGHTIVWQKPDGPPTFFLPYSGPAGVDLDKWRAHLQPPSHLHPATVHMQVDLQKFERVFVDLMSR